MYDTGEYSISDLAEVFSISPGHVSEVVEVGRWRNLRVN